MSADVNYQPQQKTDDFPFGMQVLDTYMHGFLKKLLST